MRCRNPRVMVSISACACDERRAGRQTPERVQPVIAALLRIGRAERERHPDLRERAARVIERQPQRRRQHADDGVGRGIELNRRGPTIDGSDPNCDRHKPSVSMTTCS